MKSIYLDHAAATPLDPSVLAAMQPYLATEYANPSSIYATARTTRGAVEGARATIADALGSKPTEIVFTSSGTESDNLAIQGVLRAHPGASWVTTAIEHDAVLSCALPMKTQGHEVSTVGVQTSGIVAAEDVTSAIDDTTVLVSVMLANNEIGTVQPVVEIAKQVQRIQADRRSRNVALPLYLHTDACQAAGALTIQVSHLGVDLMTINGSKIYGPKGVGLLYVRTGTVIEPLIYGGGQERGRRSGTENVAGIVGLGVSLKAAIEARHDESRRLVGLRDSLLIKLQSAVPDLIVNGDLAHRLPNNLHVTIPGVEGEALVLYLDNAGIMASTGSACSSGDLDPSHVLLAIGRSRTEAESSLRMTLGRDNDTTDIETVAKQLAQIVDRLRTIGA